MKEREERMVLKILQAVAILLLTIAAYIEGIRTGRKLSEEKKDSDE